MKTTLLSTAAALSLTNLGFSITFLGTVDDKWSNDNNWNTLAQPTASDNVTNYTGGNVIVDQAGEVANRYWQRNSRITVTTGGRLVIADSTRLAHGGAANNQHDLTVNGDGEFTSNTLNVSTAGSSDTQADILIQDTAKFTLNGNLNQTNGHGTIVYTQLGGTADIGGNFNIGSIASSTAKNYGMSVSGTSILGYGTANFGTALSTNANTLISLSGSNFAIAADTATNLGLDGQSTFTFDTFGIGTWDAQALTIDADHLFTIDLTALDQSDLSATFELMEYTSITGFDANSFTFVGNTDPSAYAFIDGDSINIALTAVPEPSSSALFSLGALSLLARRKR